MIGECDLGPWFWSRYLDDIFFIWQHGKEGMFEFFEYVNNYHDTIKYTWEWSERELSYLDFWVMLKNNRISTDVYSKQTDTHQYLDSRSCHPTHVKRGIPYGQALRMRRICDSDEVFKERLKELEGNLVKRGFKKNLIDEQFFKAKAKRREDLLFQNIRSKAKEKSMRIPLVVNFHPALSGIGKVVNSLWPILHTSDDMKKVFGAKPIVSFRRPRNLKDESVRVKLNDERIINVGMKKCGKSRYKFCRFVEEGRDFEGHGNKFKINYSFNCDSEDVVYLISCTECRKKFCWKYHHIV